MNITPEEHLILKEHKTMATILNEKHTKEDSDCIDCVPKSKLQVSDTISQEDFIKQYNRLFFSKRYIEAFMLCLIAIHTPLLNSTAKKKGEELLPFLYKKGEIHTPTSVDIDFIISVLLDGGYKKIYMQKEDLLTLPFMKISIKNNEIHVNRSPLAIILYVFAIISIPGYPLFPIIFPFFMVSLIKRRRIIKLIGNALLTRTQND